MYKDCCVNYDELFLLRRTETQLTWIALRLVRFSTLDRDPHAGGIRSCSRSVSYLVPARRAPNLILRWLIGPAYVEEQMNKLGRGRLVADARVRVRPW